MADPITTELVRLTLGGRGPERLELVPARWPEVLETAELLGIELEPWQQRHLFEVYASQPRRHVRARAVITPKQSRTLGGGS